MNNKEYTKCKKCGCLLAERNFKRDYVMNVRKIGRTSGILLIKIIAMVFIGIALIISMAVIWFHINKKYPVSYEDCFFTRSLIKKKQLIGIQEKQLFLYKILSSF